MKRQNLLIGTMSCLIIVLMTTQLPAQGGPGRGPGGPGFRGGRQDPTFETDREVFHFLLAHGDKIKRQVKNLENGIETVTESDDPEITAKIQEHVAAMYDRLEEKRPIHMRDPLFRELFQHTDKIKMTSEDTEKGIRVTETSKDPYVVKLLHEHARVVSLFIKNGFDEAHKNHAVPNRADEPVTKAVTEPGTGVAGSPGCCQQCKCQGEEAKTGAAGKPESCCQAAKGKQGTTETTAADAKACCQQKKSATAKPAAKAQEPKSGAPDKAGR